MGFPSPYGDYGSYHVTIAEQSSQNQNGFRPLTGIMVLIKEDAIRNYVENMGFPSPYGDYGSYQSSIQPFSWYRSLFPSPYGDYGSYQGNSVNERSTIINVSVPLRGLWFLSAPLINGFIAPSKMPFAGRIFFSHHFSHFCGK